MLMERNNTRISLSIQEQSLDIYIFPHLLKKPQAKSSEVPDAYKYSGE